MLLAKVHVFFWKTLVGVFVKMLSIFFNLNKETQFFGITVKFLITIRYQRQHKEQIIEIYLYVKLSGLGQLVYNLSNCTVGILNYLMQCSLLGCTVFQYMIWNRSQKAPIET